MASPSRHLHPELTPEERRNFFLRGVELFNERRFFECHEAFEEIWRSTTPEPRNLFQGLIQVAVGFYHHVERRRRDVACRVMAKGRRRLTNLEPEAEQEFGLDVASLVEAALRWEAWLAEPDGPAPEVPRLTLRNP